MAELKITRKQNLTPGVALAAFAVLVALGVTLYAAFAWLILEVVGGVDLSLREAIAAGLVFATLKAEANVGGQD